MAPLKNTVEYGPEQPASVEWGPPYTSSVHQMVRGYCSSWTSAVNFKQRRLQVCCHLCVCSAKHCYLHTNRNTHAWGRQRLRTTSIRHHLDTSLSPPLHPYIYAYTLVG
ncbi:unnamed protein product [Parnassius mnemosyne]|uniref:Uncharacterized protein n=1 Tax=Parnassius mnemosyne TaxID=213953 RepID=A0AAV1MBG1_9NEOP